MWIHKILFYLTNVFRPELYELPFPFSIHAAFFFFTAMLIDSCRPARFLVLYETFPDMGLQSWEKVLLLPLPSCTSLGKFTLGLGFLICKMGVKTDYLLRVAVRITWDGADELCGRELVDSKAAVKVIYEYINTGSQNFEYNSFLNINFLPNLKKRGIRR